MCSVINSRDNYVQKIPIDSAGEIKESDSYLNGGSNILAMVKSVAANREGFNKVVQDLKNKFGNLEILVNEQGGEIIVTFKSRIKINSFVYWENQGIKQWKEPRRVVMISDNGLYVFVEGSMTGIPIRELTVSPLN